jgi:hypothetical protein
LSGGFSCWFRPLLESYAVDYVVETDSVATATKLVIESWDGNFDMFQAANDRGKVLGTPVLWAIVFDKFAFDKRRAATMANAWAAGIDTSKLRLIVVQEQEPKTLHAARTVVDTAVRNGWKEFVLLSGLFHTARSAQIYRELQSQGESLVFVIGHSTSGIDTEN